MSEIKPCHSCIHHECCLWLWEFSFPNTDSRIQEREDFGLGMTPHCGHYFEDKYLHTKIAQELTLGKLK